MSRIINVGGAQVGPIGRNEGRQQVVSRLMDLMREAKSKGCDLVVYPELCLTTFFPRWYMEDQSEVDAFFETEMPSHATQPLFEEARNLGLGFYLGYAEKTEEDGKIRHFNTSILVNKTGEIIGKYRKIHLPGHADHRPDFEFQHLEKRYFEVGDLGFQVWGAFGGKIGMCICNDRRWPETYRVMTLRGAEMILCGYNTPTKYPGEPAYDHLSAFHNHLVMQSGAYQNACWVAGIAKAGNEEGADLLAGSAIIAPSGEIVAQASSRDDELIVAKCDLDQSLYNRRTMFNFAAHRVPSAYRLITETAGPIHEK